METNMEEIKKLFSEVVEILENGSHLPFSDKISVPEDKLVNIIEQLRDAIPEEVMKADRLDSQTREVLKQAREEADAIVDEAKEQAKKIVDGARAEVDGALMHSDIVVGAETEAKKLQEDAKIAAVKMRQEADRFAFDTKEWATKAISRDSITYLTGYIDDLLRDITDKRGSVRRNLEMMEKKKFVQTGKRR